MAKETLKQHMKQHEYMNEVVRTYFTTIAGYS